MRWPWQSRVERRESVPFTDAIVAALSSRGSRAASRACWRSA